MVNKIKITSDTEVSKSMKENPELKKVIEKVNQVLLNEDLAYYVVLVNQIGAESVIKISPSWANIGIAKGDNNTAIITRISESSNGCTEKDKEKDVITETMLATMSGIIGEDSIMFSELLKAVMAESLARHISSEITKEIAELPDDPDKEHKSTVMENPDPRKVSSGQKLH